MRLGRIVLLAARRHAANGSPFSYDRLASTSPSASRRAAQYSFNSLAVSRSGSLVCWTATELLELPFGRNPTATMESFQFRRIDFGSVAVRIRTAAPVNQRRRVTPSAHASNRVLTG